MMSLNEMNNQVKPNSASLNIMKEIKANENGSVYPILFEMLGQNTMALAGLSDFSLMLLDVEKLKPVNHIPEAHKRKINGIFIGEDHCYSCSNDGFVKVWDLKSKNPLVSKFKADRNNEVYSVSQAKHVLGGGSQGEIYFWDLRNGTSMMTFNETHPEDVSSLEFFKETPSLMLTASIDGMVCLFDLKKENEEEAAETVMVLEQPINTCRFFEGDSSAAYAMTTAQTIIILSLADAKVAKTVFTIPHVETNDFTLLETYTRANDPLLYYLRGNLNGVIEEYTARFMDADENLSLNKYLTGHKGPLTATKKLTDEYILSSGEDGTFQVTQKITPPKMFDFQALKKEMYIENEGK